MIKFHCLVPWIIALLGLALFSSNIYGSCHWAPELEKELLKINWIQLFDETIQEVKRVDGDVLPSRNKKSPTFDESVLELRNMLQKNTNDLGKIGQIFKYLDATYIGGHSRLGLGKCLKTNSKKYENFTIRPIINNIESSDTKFVVGRIYNKDSAVKKGDQIVKIYGKSIDEIRNINNVFCKDYSLLVQCDLTLGLNLFLGYLPLNLSNPKIPIELKRGTSTYHTHLFSMVKPKNIHDSIVKKNKNSFCKDWNSNLPSYHLIHESQDICLFENISKKLAVLKIRHFSDPELEAEQLQNIWDKKSGNWKGLAIDLVDNHGGDIPAPLARFLLDQPFQDQWVRHKRIREFDDPTFRAQGIVYISSKEVIFRHIDVWNPKKGIPIGEFLPSIPQFCIGGNVGVSCIKDKLEPRKNSFKGNMTILVNHNCASSCNGFAWILKEHRKNKPYFIGMPDSGDNTYDRAVISVNLDPTHKKGYSLKVIPSKLRRNLENANNIFNFTVSISKTTDENGKNLSMTPLELDKFIPYYANKTNWLKRSYLESEKYLLKNISAH